MMPNRFARRHFLSLLIGSALLPACQSHAQQPRPQRVRNFKILDSLLYRERPDLGFERVMVYGGAFWKKGGGFDTPYEPAVRDHANWAAKSVSTYVIDIETWPMDIRRDSPDQVRESMRKLIQIYDWMKSEQPKMRIGLYLFPPLRDYWTPVRRLPGTMDAWRRANEFLRPLADRIDFLAPSLYTFYDNPKGWRTYAEANIAEALRFSKPVFPVLWPRYHVSNKKLRGTFIASDFWLTQLETVRDSGVNGLILWDSTLRQPTSAFDPNWEWWKTTQQFIKTL